MSDPLLMRLVVPPSLSIVKIRHPKRVPMCFGDAFFARSASLFLYQLDVNLRPNLTWIWRLGMKMKRFLWQIVGMLKQVQAGVPVVGIIRRAGIKEQTFYRWKAKYAGLEVDEVRRRAQWQEEKMRLKQLVAEITLDKAMLQNELSKNGKVFTAWTDGRGTRGSYGVAERRACRVLRAPRGDLALPQLPRSTN